MASLIKKRSRKPRSAQINRAETRIGRPRSERIDISVLEATAALLSEKGFLGMSLEAIASRAGVGKAAIYRRWRSKEELVIELLSRDAANIEPTPELGETRAELTWLVNDTIRCFTQTPIGGINRGLASVLALNPELNRAVHEHIIRGRREEFRAVLERGIARGEIRPDVDVEIGHDLLIGPVHYYLVLGEKLDETLGERFVDAFFRGVAQN
jgi:AcrR family transcriptional regulator